MNCPHCNNDAAIKYGTKRLKDGSILQTYLCKTCTKRCNERTGSPIARLRTPVQIVSVGLKMRTEGTGIRATGRVLEKFHTTIIGSVKRVAAQESNWSPPAPESGEVTIEGNDFYTRACCEPLTPLRVKGVDD